jgi:hypothetical protein
MLAEVLQSEGGIYRCIPDYGFYFVPFCKLEVPKMWENGPVLQFNAFCILIPRFEVKSQ